MKETIIVTGANGQIGKALIFKLIDDNYNVIGIDITHDADTNNSSYSRVTLDITNENEVQKFFKTIQEDSSVSGLVNNAGIAVFTPFEERSYADLKRVMDVNIAGTVMMTKGFMLLSNNPSLQKRTVNIGSIYGEVAPDITIYGDTPRMSSEIYGMTKAAIINFTKYMTSYYATSNARFNCISPGGIINNQGPEFIRQYSSKVPMGRMANCDEVVEAICFLLSKNSSYINGENIFVDGGLTKW